MIRAFARVGLAQVLWALVLLALVLVAGVPAGAAADAPPWPSPPAHSADLIVGRDHPRAGRMWRTPEFYRHEIDGGGAAKDIVILRLSDNRAEAQLPMGLALDIDFARSGIALDALLAGRDLNPRAEGVETIDGRKTTRYRVALDKGVLARFNGQIWVTREGILMRLKGDGAFAGQAGRVDVEVRNVKIAPQPADLFQLPGAGRRLKVDAMSAATLLQGLGLR